MIIMESVTKTFRSGRGEIGALKGVSLTLGSGVFAVVTGRSGSGKSTLLGCIGGLEYPDDGKIFCDGMAIHHLDGLAMSQFQRHQVGFVFQRSNLLSYLSVYENIEFPLILNGFGKKERKGIVSSLLDRIGLEKAADALPHELSGGESQRVAVARALSHEPKILLADEPTSNLDSITGRQLVALIRNMAKETRCTVMVATHDTEIIDPTDIHLQIEDGRIHEKERL